MIPGVARGVLGTVKPPGLVVDFFSDIGFLPAARILTESGDSFPVLSCDQFVNLTVITLLCTTFFGGFDFRFFIASRIPEVLSLTIFEGRLLSLSVLARFSSLDGFNKLPFPLTLGACGLCSGCGGSIVGRIAGRTEMLSRRGSPFFAIFAIFSLETVGFVALGVALEPCCFAPRTTGCLVAIGVVLELGGFATVPSLGAARGLVAIDDLLETECLVVLGVAP